MSRLTEWLRGEQQPRTPVAAHPPRVAYGDEALRDQVSAAIAIAASSPEPRHVRTGS